MIGQVPRIQQLVVSGPAYLLHDTFTDTDGTSLADHTMDVGDGWTVHDATAWTVQSNKAAKGVASADRFWHVSADAGEADVVVECELTLPSATAMGVCVRVTDGTQHYTVTVDANNFITIREVNGAGYSSRASVAYTYVADATVTLRVELAGSTITASIGATSVSYELATVNQTATRFGLTGYDGFGYSADGRYDNFTVANP